MSISIIEKTRNTPKHPYQKIAETILGKSYVLTLVFIGAHRAEKLNKKHRGKSYVPNVLSFPLSEQVGEIYITPEVAKREAKNYKMSVHGYIGYLFIHGLLHLKGYDHGATMEKAEQKYVRQFGLK